MTEIRRSKRRVFLRQSACAAVGMTAVANTIFDLRRIADAATTADGPLWAPRTRDENLTRAAAVPPQLFSHSDQPVHWQTSLPDQPAKTGWGGRTADLLQSLNENARISMSISVAGTHTL